jgi:transposase
MRKAAEVYRLYFEHKMGVREISRSLNISHSTVSGYLSCLSESGKSYPIGEKDLEEMLGHKKPGRRQSASRKPELDCAWIDEELKKKGVTLLLLWQEYREMHQGEGYGYSRFCDLYKAWSKRLPASMRQRHKAGEKMFVDYAGPTMSYYDAASGEVRKAVLFVSVLGASNYTYAEVQSGQDSRNWIMGHVRSFEYFEGVPDQVVPDNLKSGVSSPCFYDPIINQSYHELSLYYKTAILPTRVRKPKYKAKVEVGVLIAERWIMAVLRNEKFFSLDELNAAIRKLLERLNNKVMKRYGKSRRELWEKLEKGQLKALPSVRYEYKKCKTVTVGIDYHVSFEKNSYSVPYGLMGQKAEVHAAERMIEIVHKGDVVARHLRCLGQGEYITVREHMPSHHQSMQVEWNGLRFMRWASTIGANTEAVIAESLESREHPEQAFRRYMGILSLAKRYGPDRLEAACSRGRLFGHCSYRSIKHMLANDYDRLDQHPDEREPETTLPEHANVRGSQYYKEQGGASAN